MMTDAQDAMIRSMAASGRTAREIAASIGRANGSVKGHCSRNNIQLGLRRRRRRKSEIEQRVETAPAPRAEPPLGPYPRWSINGIGVMQSSARPRPDGPGIDLLDHRAGQCLFILGEAARMRCCGAAASGSWCGAHWKAVFE